MGLRWGFILNGFNAQIWNEVTVKWGLRIRNFSDCSDEQNTVLPRHTFLIYLQNKYKEPGLQCSYHIHPITFSGYVTFSQTSSGDVV